MKIPSEGREDWKQDEVLVGEDMSGCVEMTGRSTVKEDEEGGGQRIPDLI